MDCVTVQQDGQAKAKAKPKSSFSLPAEKTIDLLSDEEAPGPSRPETAMGSRPATAIGLDSDDEDGPGDEQATNEVEHDGGTSSQGSSNADDGAAQVISLDSP